MFTAVFLQAAVSLLAAAVTWAVWGTYPALSLLAGGGAIVIPNALLALRLTLGNPSQAAVTLLVGEFLKIGLSVLLIYLAHLWIADLSWGALILGLVLALNVLLLAPWVSGRMDRRRAAQAVAGLIKNKQT
jgi:ATP synthase protein I